MWYSKVGIMDLLNIEKIGGDFFIFRAEGLCNVYERAAGANKTGNEEKLEAFLRERDEQRQRQSELIHEDIVDERLKKVDLIAAGRLAKNIKKNCLKKLASHGDDNEQKLTARDLKVSSKETAVHLNLVTPETRSAIEREIMEMPVDLIKEDHILTELPLTSVFDDENSFLKIQLNAPSEKRSSLKFAVFKDLHDRGYFLTGGFKFGGDFLVYPGDPFVYHASYIALIVENKDKILTLDKFAYCRLGSLVKKTFLLCYWNDNCTQVTYESLNWLSSQ